MTFRDTRYEQAKPVDELQKEGIVKSIPRDEQGRLKGFGFIRDLPDGPERFFHASELVPPLTLDQVHQGHTVKFIPAVNAKDGRLRACRVELV